MGVFCYVVSPVNCSSARRSSAFPGAAYRPCQRTSSSPAPLGGKCERSACLWAFYQEGLDWRYATKTYTELRSCKQLCLDDPSCTGIEWAMDGSHCAFWMRSKCNVSEESILGYRPEMLGYVTCTFSEREGIDPTTTTVSLTTTVLIPANPARPPEECLGCAAGAFKCDRQCRSTPMAYAFDFTYRHSPDSCLEHIPKSNNSMMVDTDTWCVSPGLRYVISCENMKQYDFSGISLTSGCQSTATATRDLVRERCSWQCKHQRPFTRCQWDFDRFGRFADVGHMDQCWMWETCQSNSVAVAVVCQPSPAARAANTTTRVDLLREREAHALARDELDRARAALEAAERAVEEASERLSEVSAHADMNNSTSLQELEAARENLQEALNAYKESAALVAEAEETKLSLETAIKDYRLTEEELARERGAHGLTKDRLEEEEEGQGQERAWMLALAAALVVLVCCLGCAIFILLRRRGRKAGAAAEASAAGTGAEGRDVVIGRPVADGGEGGPPAQGTPGTGAGVGDGGVGAAKPAAGTPTCPAAAAAATETGGGGGGFASPLDGGADGADV